MKKPTHTARRIVIIGGGVSGLSIATRLAQAGLPVTVLESARLGMGASTRNQGWLHSGAWFATRHADLARMCHDSLQQTLRFCPDCREPGIESMAYVISRPDTLAGRYFQAWKAAGIPCEEWPLNDLLAKLPLLDRSQVQSAFRLPDCVIHPDVLLAHLAAAAENVGAEIRVSTTVTGLTIEQGTAIGVVTDTREEIRARLVILAANAGSGPLWPTQNGGPTTDPSADPRVALKTHLVSVRPVLGPVPLCVLDSDGLNHLPHHGTSVFGTDRWQTVARPEDQSVAPDEILSLWNLVHRFFPGATREHYRLSEWAGTTMQVRHAGSGEPRAVPLPTVIDHARQSPAVENLLSVFPGRATLWPQLAEECRRLVLDRCGSPASEVQPPLWGRA